MKNLDEIKRIIKYLFSAGSSFVIDLILFTIFNYLLKDLGSISIIVATIIARILSSLYNYFLNSRFVFGNYDKSSIIKYYALVVIQMIVSATSVYLLSMVFAKINDTIIKMVIDVVIFIVNYIIQKRVIFK